MSSSAEAAGRAGALALDRPLRAPPPRTYELAAADGVGLRLTRYRGGEKGPVLLSHCIGVSSRMYSLGTIETNLVESLTGAGYDVWLLDFRFSIELPARERASSFDEVATLDYPAAVAAVREHTGAARIDVVAHGVGSSTFVMAMLSGLQGVRSAVCSQVATHLRAPPLNRFKAALRLPDALAAVGVRTMTSRVEESVGERLYDATLRLHPIERGERCDSRVCRRITAMYGPLYRHAQLNEATHGEALPALFGTVNLRAYRQLTRILRAGQLVDERGNDRYLPNLDRLRIPILFLHGGANDCLLPETTRITFELLSERHGPELYRREEIPGYGHVDCIFGAHAARDVYPSIHAHLERAA